MEEVLEIKGTEFNRAELKRLIDFIPQTDPRSIEYGKLLENIERYVYFANVIAAAQNFIEYGVQPQPVTDNIIPFAPPTGEADKFEEQIEEVDDDTEYDPAEVKSMITKARAEKKIASIKEWINSNFGVDGFSAIPAKQYPQVVSKLKELGVS